METITTKQWLVVFFIHEIDTFQPMMDEHIEAIQANGCGPDTAVYLLCDHVKPRNGILNFTLSVFRLDRIAGGKFLFNEVTGLTFDNQDRHCWETGLQFIFSEVQAARTMLITLSHGAAFGINRDFGPVSRPPIHMTRDGIARYQLTNHDQLIIYNNPYYYFDQKEMAVIQKNSAGFRGRSLDEKPIGAIPKGANNELCRNLEILWTADLASALEKLPAIPGKPVIDVMLMVNCYMQTFETGYNLRNQVGYLLAAETAIPLNGFDFAALLGHLSQPGMPTEDLLQLIVADYEIKNPPGTSNFDNYFFTANRLAPYTQALELFEQVLKILEENFEAIKDELVNIREKFIKYVSLNPMDEGSNRLMMIDAYFWISLLFEHLPELFKTTTLAADFKQMLNKIVRAQHNGQTFIDFDAQDNPEKFGLNGLSLFYPLKADLLQLEPLPLCANFDELVPSPFRKDSAWNEFLAKF